MSYFELNHRELRLLGTYGSGGILRDLGIGYFRRGVKEFSEWKLLREVFELAGDNFRSSWSQSG